MKSLLTEVVQEQDNEKRVLRHVVAPTDDHHKVELTSLLWHRVEHDDVTGHEVLSVYGRSQNSKAPQKPIEVENLTRVDKLTYLPISAESKTRIMCTEVLVFHVLDTHDQRVLELLPHWVGKAAVQQQHITGSGVTFKLAVVHAEPNPRNASNE